MYYRSREGMPRSQAGSGRPRDKHKLKKHKVKVLTAEASTEHNMGR